MKLYYTPGACSLSTHIALREAGAHFDMEKVDLKAHRTESGRDYYEVSPNGYVPALELDDGTVLTEAAALAQFVADDNPGRALAPEPRTVERAKFNGLLTFISTELHKGFGPLFYPTTPAEVVASTKEKIAKRFDHVEKLLSEGRDYLFGPGFTVADGYLFTILNWAKKFEFDLGRWPKLAAYRERIAGREAVQAAMKAEGLV